MACRSEADSIDNDCSTRRFPSGKLGYCSRPGRSSARITSRALYRASGGITLTNLLVELLLKPDADAKGLATSAQRIQSPALRVEGVVATRNISATNAKPSRLVLNVWGETFDRAFGLASLMRAWTGVDQMNAAEVVFLEGLAVATLGDEPAPMALDSQTGSPHGLEP